jgi:hypothetical protein
MASSQKKDIDLLTMLGLGSIIGIGLKQNEVATREKDILALQKENTNLKLFLNRWLAFDKRWKERFQVLRRFNLTSIIPNLPESIREIYKEAVVCYLCGRDLAASNMVCLAIEVSLREITGDQTTRLNDLIERFTNQEGMSPDLKRKLHIIREMRNVQSHSVNILSELDFLSLLEANQNILALKTND